MKAVCPFDPNHARFETTAHVVQSWEVDSSGDFVAHLEDLETTHDPDAGNIWTCLECQRQAVVYDDDETRETLTLASDGESSALPIETGPRQRLSGLAERRA